MSNVDLTNYVPDANTQDNTVLDKMAAWADELLAAGKLPESPGNIEDLVAQQYYEGGATQDQAGGATNPLDIRNGPGGSIQPYQTTNQGLQQSINTIKTMDPAYYKALSSNTGNDPTPDIAGLAASQWAGLNSTSAGRQANKAYAGQVSSAVNTIYGGEPNVQLSAMTKDSSGQNIVTPKGGYDVFTQAMINLDSVINSGGALPFEMLVARGALATGFAILGFFGVAEIGLGAISGGKAGIGSLPGIAAGFLAGTEAGMSNTFNKLGIRKPSSGYQPNTELAQQRLALSQQKEARVSAESERRSIQSAQMQADRLQKNQLAQFRAQTQRKAVNLKARQQRNLERALRES